MDITVKRYMDEADGYFSNYWVFVSIEQKTGVSKVIFGSAFYFLMLFISYFNLGASVIVNLFGFCYAFYVSSRSITNKNLAAYIQWQTFWYIYGFLSVLEFFNNFLLYWLPKYYFYKFLFFVWLMYPSTRGATTVYFFFNSKIKSQVAVSELKNE
ncbi:hypothetical protein BB560_000303 [Smittium megazygosporum]|uniref:Protein YOP1 n=1 Tax=Smittium megazygosporum TaxID=133381 RepID=A0A2T9ZKP9_9FUNG|nr:hypothetical protein BB560_000303 [Smittium megazygosporum]